MAAKKSNNKMKIYILLLSIIVTACNQNESIRPHREMIYNLYNNKNKIIHYEYFKVKIFPSEKFDSIIVFKNDSVYCSYKQFSDSTGIYRINNGQITKTHSFTDTLLTEFLFTKPPFLNSNVSCRDSKVLTINEEPFKLYHFIENTGNHTSYDSYFIKDIGFICYYSFDKDRYILCDSLIDNSKETMTIKGINKALISDSTFFAKHVLKKLLPNYHRTKSLEGI